MRKCLFTSVLLLLVALAACIAACRHIAREAETYKANQRALLADVEFYRTRDSLSAASVERLSLTRAELEERNAELAATIKTMGLKLRRLESAASTTTSTTVDLTAPMRDTVIVEKGEPSIAQAFDWSDAWVSVSGILRPDEGEVTCHVQSVDTLVQVVHRVPRRFLFIKWGTKAVRQEVASRNPHTRIVYTEYIEMKK